MDVKYKKFIKNVWSMFLANGIAFLISTLITFIVPKFLSIEEYSYIQLYIFYTSYVSYLHYGWVDGIRLRYGGAYYDKLDKSLFSAQIWSYSIFQVVIATGVICTIFFNVIPSNRKIVLLGVGVCMLIRLPRLMPQYILEMTNRIEECAKITVIEKVSYFILTVLVIVTGNLNLVTILLCDLIAQIISAIYAFWECRDIIKVKPIIGKDVFLETKDNIFSGVKLTIANVSSLLVIGIIRQFIEKQWDISTFGRISLTISISNLLMVFIRAIAMVMFPMLRRVNKEKLVKMYPTMRICLMVPLLGMLIGYYPLKVIMSNWLPQYAESLKYMALLFPMCVFESKMSMLIETYMKTLRKEKWLFTINVITVVLSFSLAYISTVILHNLTSAVISIVFLLAFRCVFAELILGNSLKISVSKDIILEVLLATIFILSNWFIGGINGMIIYIVAYLIYLLLVKNNIKKVFGFILNKNEFRDNIKS